jgi:ATP-dependent DNA helicase RecQ
MLDKILKVTTILSPAPVVKRDGRYYRTATKWEPDGEKFKRLTELRLQEQACIQRYARSSECLMELIERELNDPYATRCGVCANCVGKPLLSDSPKKETVMEAIEFLRRCDDPITPRKISQTHEGFKGKISAEMQANEGRALCFWGDAGWGEMVRRGKLSDGHFSDDLVTAMEEMIRLRWKPEPFPTWITCVPSLTKPQLVPDFAERLAVKLGLPFSQCVVKRMATDHQKRMENSHFQLKNVLDTFEIATEKVLQGPVLLVDDMVDSGWTFTVISRLLRLAGADSVLPAALARVIGD